MHAPPNKRLLAILVLSVSLFFADQPTLAQERGSFRPKLSLKLTAGPKYMAVGDLNHHITSFDDYMAGSIGFYRGGKMKGIGHLTPDLEGEFRVQVRPRFALALGSGYLSGSNHSDFQTVGTFPFSGDWSPSLFEFVVEPRIRTIPLKLGLYYSLPLVSRVEFLLNGGIGLYFSKASLVKINRIHYLAEPTIPEEPEIYDQYDVRGNGLGFHGGVGLEYRLTRSVFLVLDAQGRYARIRRLSGSRVFWNSSPWIMSQGTDEGVLYIGTRDMTAEGYGDNCPDLVVSPSQNVRRAALDFSGFSLTVGLRIKLF